MGFFSSVKKNLGAIAGGVAGAALAPTGFGFLGGAAGAQIGQQLFGDDPQVDALRRAGRIEEAQRLANEKFQQFILEQTAVQREAAARAIPQLEAELTAESPLFQRQLQRGLTGLGESFAAQGLRGSTAQAEAAGEFTTGLTAQDIGRRTAILQGLAGGATTGLGPALGAQQLTSGLAGRLAQTQAGIGGVQAAGQQALFGNLLQLGLLGQLNQQQVPQTPETLFGPQQVAPGGFIRRTPGGGIVDLPAGRAGLGGRMF